VLVEQGLASTVVPAFAASADADLVVVGSRGQGTLRRLLIGSTASHLLRKSRVPVLIVKAPGRVPYGRVLIPVDFSPAGELTIRMAREAAPDAFIVLLNVFDVPFESMLQYAGVSQDDIHRYRIEARQRSVQQLHELAARAGLDPSQYTMLVEHGDATAVIVHQMERHDCDLIVMGKHGTHVSEELLLGSVTKRVLDESDVDMLVVVDKRRPDSTVP
jgi:nucleotide-binding universal stress UspA family protein